MFGTHMSDPRRVRRRWELPPEGGRGPQEDARGRATERRQGEGGGLSLKYPMRGSRRRGGSRIGTFKR